MHPDDVARYTCLNEHIVVTTIYYDAELLARLGMLDDIRWLFAWGAMGHFLEIKEHIYQDLTLEFLNTLYVEVTRRPQCQPEYISFYLQGQFYELKLGTFDGIFDFWRSMDVPNWQVPWEFNPNAFLGKLSGNVRYSTSSSKCTHIRNPCIRVALCILACCFFAWGDSLNVQRLSELYFLSYMLDGVQLDLSSFLARKLYSDAISTKGRIVIGGIVTTIAGYLGIDPNPEDRVFGFERLDRDFCKVNARCLCWIYPGDLLFPLSSVDQTTLLHWANLYWVSGDNEVIQLAPHHPAPHSSQAGPSYSSQPPLLTIPTSKTPLDPFKRSKFSFEHLLLLRKLLFGTFSKSTTMSYVECLLPRLNISRTTGYV